MRTQMPASVLLGILMLLGGLATACGGPASDESRQRTERMIALAAIRALPVDSLCALSKCVSVTLDSAVRSAPTPSDTYIGLLSVAFSLEQSEVRNNLRSSVPIEISAYPAEELFVRGSMVIAVSVVQAVEPKLSEAIAHVTVRVPGTYGLVAVVRLRREESEWLASSIEYLES